MFRKPVPFSPQSLRMTDTFVVVAATTFFPCVFEHLFRLSHNIILPLLTAEHILPRSGYTCHFLDVAWRGGGEWAPRDLFFLFFLIQSIGLLMQRQQERDKNWVARRPEWRFGSARFYQVNASGQPQYESVDVAFRSRAVEAWQQLQSRFYDPSNAQPIKCLFSNKAGRTCAI